MSTDLVTEALARQEEIIARGLQSFLEVGDALQVIRSDRLYLLTHTTFAAYCQDRWGFSDSRARQLVLAAQTVTSVTVGGLPAPTNESQTRELGKVPEPDRERVWAETLERTAGKPTAEAVREVAAPVVEAKPPAGEPAKAKPTKRDKTAARIESALWMYAEFVAATSSAEAALAVIDAYGQDGDAACGAVARAVIAEHRAARKAAS
jgi:hypothetical protein